MQDLRIVTNKNIRDNGMDFISGILILYMVLVHLFQFIDIYKGNILYYMQFLNFYMPWFFYKGGKYFKRANTKSIHSIGLKRLIYPYVRYSLIGYLVYCLCLFIKGDYNLIHYLFTPIKSFLLTGSIPGNNPLWFLLTLYFIRILANKIAEYNNITVYTCVIVCFLLGFIMNYFKIYKPDYMLNVTTGLGFFLIGYKTGNITIRKYIGLLFILCYIILWLVSFSSVEMRHNILERGEYLLWPICSIIGIFSINFIVSNLNFSKSNTFVQIGCNSMIFLVWHWPIIQLISIFL